MGIRHCRRIRHRKHGRRFQRLATRYVTPPRVAWAWLDNVRKPALLDALSGLLRELRAGFENSAPIIEIG